MIPYNAVNNFPVKKSFVRAGLFAAGLFAVFIIMNGKSSASRYGLGAYGNCGYSETCEISITTSGSVSLDVQPTAGGSYTIDKDTVDVTTNSFDGYTLSLEMSSDTSNALESVSSSIAAHSGTTGSPSALTGNVWGFRVAGLGSFGVGPTTASQNQTSSSLTFAGVPLLNNAVILKTTNINAPTGDQTDVWYGVRADTSLPSGSYTGTVLYTAVAL